MNIKLLNEQDPYNSIICNYFASLFPKTIIPNGKQLLEILSTIIVGDKNTRLGPVPLPESMVVIRKVIDTAIKLNEPIPVLVAWGGRKTIANAPVDVAEISALYQLIRLQESVSHYYKPGMVINIRIEDTGALWVYKNQPDTEKNVEEYSEAFAKIVSMLCYNHNIYPIRESWLMNKEEYFKVSTTLSSFIETIIQKKLIDPTLTNQMIPEFAMIEQSGWKGDLPLEQINHYLDRYKTLYPDNSAYENIEALADYFAGAKVRYDLGGRAEPKTPVGSYIGISFVPPITGAPESLFNNTVYYRTVPEKDGRTHIAPWRGKGYLEIQPDNSIKMKIASFYNHEIVDNLVCNHAEFNHNFAKVSFNADYMVKDFIMPIQLI